MQHEDTERSDRADQERLNRQSNMEPAEGSREATDGDAAANQGGSGANTINRGSDLTEEAVGQPDDQAGGISNRPLEEEQGRQENLPPRGERRENWKED